jgi:hypothetical protein
MTTATSSILYEKVNQKRKSWVPIESTGNESCTNGCEDLLSRCLSLKVLELPVKDFILEGLNKADKSIVGDEGVKCLSLNVLDEERHDIAIGNCIKSFKDYNPYYESTANSIVSEWVNHPDDSITKAAVLENGVFFIILPIYRQFGTPSMRSTSLDISADEINHVQSHRYTSKLLGWKPSKSLDNLRKATVAWIVDSFNGNFSPYKDKFIKASDELMYKGITKELDFSKTYTNIAFFERNNTSLPSYY